ncbi:MAG: DNA-deoxyinosine glycosylase [Lachnospiraceae bacterium]|nr:DNA-deoxyinosine glycosylase [Lachnospiraceae bacterium]
MIVHPIPPLYDKDSNILILGSFPSVKSREEKFFYGHPQNRFWKVLATLFGEETPKCIPEKEEFLHRNHVALWDTIHSCDIEGSADSTIKNVVPNDLRVITENANIKRIFVNGNTSEKYYKKYIEPDLKIKAVCLPSTSPANAVWSVEGLVEAWKEILI